MHTVYICMNIFISINFLIRKQTTTENSPNRQVWTNLVPAKKSHKSGSRKKITHVKTQKNQFHLKFQHSVRRRCSSFTHFPKSAQRKIISMAYVSQVNVRICVSGWCLFFASRLRMGKMAADSSKLRELKTSTAYFYKYTGVQRSIRWIACFLIHCNAKVFDNNVNLHCTTPILYTISAIRISVSLKYMQQIKRLKFLCI